MITAACTECGNPDVHMMWGGDVTSHTWTGSCDHCGSILFATKDKVKFEAPTGEKAS